MNNTFTPCLIWTLIYYQFVYSRDFSNYHHWRYVKPPNIIRVVIVQYYSYANIMTFRLLEAEE